MKELLFFTSPIGLGHATRDVAIASRLARYADVGFVSGGPAAKLISDYAFPCKDLYKHEGFDVNDRGELKHTLKWLMHYWSYYKRCKATAGELVAKNRPRLIVSDEDFASIAIAQQRGIRNVMITDILQTSFTKGSFSLIEKKMNKAMKQMISRSDLVIIPDKGDDNCNVRYVGPIVRDVDPDREALRRKLNFHGKTILVTVGGTDSGGFLIDRAIEAFGNIRDRIDAEMVVVSGPLLGIEAGKEGIRCVGYERNLHEMVYAADLLISLAGRSTIDEALTYGTPAIFVPIRKHFEQEDNAGRYGFIYDDMYRLEELILEKLNAGRRDMVSRNGADAAAGLILNLLTE